MQGLDEGASNREVGRIDDIELTNVSKVALTHGMLVEVADGVGNREHLGFLDTLQEAHSLLGVEVLATKAIKVPCTQQ